MFVRLNSHASLSALVAACVSSFALVAPPEGSSICSRCIATAVCRQPRVLHRQDRFLRPSAAQRPSPNRLRVRLPRDDVGLKLESRIEAQGIAGVVDFDAALRDPNHPNKLLPERDSGNNLHLGDAGYEAMGMRSTSVRSCPRKPAICAVRSDRRPEKELI